MKALFFSTYPIDVPRHGGQIRSASIVEALRSDGWEVNYLSIYHPDGYEVLNASIWHLPFTREALISLDQQSGRSDVNASDMYLEDNYLFKKISHIVQEFDPNTFVIEQAWLWPLAKKLISELSLKVSIIYSSHNNEELLLKNLYDNGDDNVQSHHIMQAASIERDLIDSADAVICVSTSDMKSLSLGKLPCFIAPNGVKPRSYPGGFDYWQSIYKNTNIALFVASAHPPNAIGFDIMLSPVMSKFSPEKKVVVVGSVSALIPKTPLFYNYSGINQSRIDLLGVQDEGGLSTFIELCKCFILPLTTGGGTNLKTAEALYNRKPIVATSLSFRGFEDFIGFPNVFICDEPEEFQNKLLEVLSDEFKPKNWSNDEVEKLEKLTWKSHMNGLSSFIMGIQKRKPTVIKGADLEKYVGFGWNPIEPETGNLWTSDRFSLLKIPVNSGSENNLTVNFSVYNPTMDRINLRISDETNDIVNIEIYNSSEQSVTVNLNDCKSQGNDVIELIIILSKVRSPKDFGSLDKRNIGVLLSALAFNG